MKKFILTIGLAIIASVGLGQETLYYNGCEGLPIFTGEIDENDSLELEVYTDYNMSDWGYWSPRWKITRYSYYTGYGSSNISGSHLYSSIGTFDISQLDSISIILNGVHNGWTYSSNSFSIKAIIDSSFEFTFASIPVNLGWGEYSNTLFLGDIDAFTIEIFIDLNLGGYSSSSEYDCYKGYSDFTIDDISIIGYMSESISEEPISCDTVYITLQDTLYLTMYDTVYIEQPPIVIYETDIPQECMLDGNGDGVIGMSDLLNLLQYFGNPSPCMIFNSNSPPPIIKSTLNDIDYYKADPNKIVLRIINTTNGQEVPPNTPGLLLYIYNDGTVEKRMNFIN